MKDFKEDFKEIAEYVIIDSAAGLGIEAKAVIEMSDELILVTNPEIPAIADALKTIKLAEKLKKNVLGIIITRVKRNKTEMQPETVKEMLEVPILGMIPEDITIQKSLSERDAVIHTDPKSKSARAYKEIAANLIGVEYDSDQDRERRLKRLLQKLGLVA